MLPLYKSLSNSNHVNGENPLFMLPFPKVAVGTVLLPLLSFVICVIWSLLYDFERSTFTHCGVPNYLPSISAAIGSYEPQQTIWKIGITLHIVPRLAVGMLYRKKWSKILSRRVQCWASLACTFYLIENLALFSLSFMSSSENYEAHKRSFIVFIVFSELYMLLVIILLSRARTVSVTTADETSLRCKKICFLVNIFAITFAMYTFSRHNSFCERGMYTWFALSEYVVVLSNMAFHMTAYWDLAEHRLCVVKKGVVFHC